NRSYWTARLSAHRAGVTCAGPSGRTVMTDPAADGPVELLVAGAGGGLVGALRAAELGLSVVVVEASAAFRAGHHTSLSTAMPPGAGSRYQRATGVDDSPATFLADIMYKTAGEADAVLARALVDVSARLVEWLADSLGLPMELVTDFD